MGTFHKDLSIEEYWELIRSKWGDTILFPLQEDPPRFHKVKLKAICRTHGDIMISPFSALYGTLGCSKCNKDALLNNPVWRASLKKPGKGAYALEVFDYSSLEEVLALSHLRERSSPAAGREKDYSTLHTLILSSMYSFRWTADE